uniref:TRASH domain-containing protein n=1 Tax=Ixodes ricinus TaxID=34613 RepID=A0A147BGX8_IXORI
MDTEAPAVATSNGESAAGVRAKEGADKLKSGGQEEEDVDMAECGEGGVTNGCPENASPDAAEHVDGAGSKAVNGSSEHSANEDSRQSEKNASDIEMNSGAGEDSSKGDNERKEDALDSQLDSSQADGDAVKTESTEASEELPLPDDKPVEKAKEANSGESTPSSTPLRKKKSKKVSKLSIMHAIASRLSGQAKVEPKSETESNPSESTPDASDDRLSQDAKEAEDAPPESPAKGESSSSKKAGHTCAVCSAVKGLRYQVLYQGKTQFLCSDVCFKTFRNKQKLAPKKPPEKDHCTVCQQELQEGIGFYPPLGGGKPLCSRECLDNYHEVHGPKRACAQCQVVVDGKEGPFLVWETMEFCGEDCLRRYQSVLGSHCAHCVVAVNQLSLGKYCVRFGADIRQFCSGKCLEEFKRGLKVCCLCQKDLSKQEEGFLAPVGDKGLFKDFCSQQCMERYERMNAFNAANLTTHKCVSCSKEATTKYQVEYNGESHRLCSEICVSTFRYANKIKSSVCENCHKLFENKDNQDFVLYHNSSCQQFCSKGCINLFVLAHRKIVPCSWCKVKKYNFDMVERVEPANSPSLSQLFCSLNCLSLFRVNQSASSSRAIRCDNCSKMQPAQYHLTMSDTSIRNFCSYKCVLAFQNQFTNLPTLTTTSPTVNTSTIGKSPAAETPAGTPVISNIRSLAHVAGTKMPVIPTSMQQASSATIVTASPLTKMLTTSPIANSIAGAVAAATRTQLTTLSVPSAALAASATGAKDASGNRVEREVIIQLPFPKLLRNKSMQCRPVMMTKGISCRPLACHKEMQTDGDYAVTEGTRGIIPIPVPIYVPVPLHMYSHVVPSPLPIPIPVPVPIFIPTTKDTTEQILEALKQIKEQVQNDDKFDDALLSVAELLTGTSRSKRKSSDEGESSDRNCEKRALSEEAEEPEQPRKKKRTSDDDSEPESPKAEVSRENFDTLEQTFGVNSWSCWVRQKNTELERGSQSGSRKLKLFKTDLLSLTPEELNYSLCLFIKEVRRQDGEPYTPCSVYLQCLGIQQFLFENGRHDNIFSDPQYEMFSGCLNDVLQKAHDSSAESSERISEAVLWDAKQLGAHSPLVLLNTLMYFNIRDFHLHTVEDHLKLSFTNVTKQWQKGPKAESTRILRWTPNPEGEEQDRKFMDQQENVEDPLRCPVKLYEFYVSKCPDLTKCRPDVYYMTPDRQCLPDSPTWYSSLPMGKDTMAKMLTRFSMVRELPDLARTLFPHS